MGLFDFLKKRKKTGTTGGLELPPPPSPEEPLPSAEVKIVSELPEVEEFKREKTGPIVVKERPEPIPVHEEEPLLVKEEPELPLPSKKNKEEPMFVSVQDFQEVLANISYVRTRLGDADELVKKLHTVKGTEEKEFERWRAQLEDLQRKLAYVEDVVFSAS